MGEIVEQAWSGPIHGIVVTRRGYERPLRSLALEFGTHPIPSDSSVRGGAALLRAVAGLGSGDLVLVLLSGGASALACVPVPGISIGELAELTRELLRCGATVDEINIVRRHLCLLKGGRLAAAAYPARVITLAISDVVGDTPSSIGSGPTVADPTTTADAVQIVSQHLPRMRPLPFTETVKPGDPRLARAEFRLVGSGRIAVRAAAMAAASLGYDAVMLGDELQGEARDVGAAHGQAALEFARAGRRSALISGGELTVTVRGTGRGGPNQEYALAVAAAAGGAAEIAGFAVDTDGVDGTDDIAGAWFDACTLAQAGSAGRNAAEALANNDSGGFFSAAGSLIVTGPTGTNVNDLRVLLVTPGCVPDAGRHGR
jgi:hydroxypyruvate reductase